MTYIWQHKDWPEFRFTRGVADDILVKFLMKSGKSTGQLATISAEKKDQLLVEILLSEAIKTSEIEGEFLSRIDVVSSLKRNLGIHEEQPRLVKDHRAKGISRLMVTMRNSWQEELSDSMLFTWHEMLMEGNRYIQAGKWRSGAEPMQVVSGPIGKEIVHFEAPPSNQVQREMDRFIKWFNSTAPGGSGPVLNPLLRSAIVHLYFESIHPFEDGNGRIGRVLAEKAIHQGVGQPVLISISQVIEANRNVYYEQLKQAQRGLEIDDWVIYFSGVVFKAQENSEELIDFTLQKTRFFDSYHTALNEREIKVLNRMLEEGPSGFEGGINANKYMSITRASKATATRDLQHLRDLGILIPEGEGRSVRYQIRLLPGN